jgi:drug/metabolite transporter (DMT)-like permease
MSNVPHSLMPDHSQHHLRLIRIVLLITVVVWGSTFVATKICLKYLTPAEVLGFRLLLAVPVLFGMIITQGIKLRFSSSEIRTLLIGSGILTLHFLIQIIGLQYTTATNTGWIIAVTPLVIVVLSYFFLKEKIRAADTVGIIIATLGILILMSGGDFSSLGWLSSTGDWLILASAHTWAIYTVLGRNISRSHNPIAVTFGFLLPASIVMTAYMALTSDWNKFVHMPVEPLVAIVFLGVVAMALANWWWQKSIAAIGAAKAGVFLYLEPLATTALAVPLLHESFGVFTAVGGLLVLFGVYWSQRGT